MGFNRNPLTLALGLLIGGALASTAASALAQEHQEDSELPVIVVTALGLDENTNKIVAPFSVLGEKKIFEGQGTLGDLLNGLPGVHSDTFGGGASRPIVRGQTSPRVKVLSDGAGLLDASDISPDHAVTADPLLAHKVEVVRGPATLLYGGGAIGGVVNVLDNKIPTSVPEEGAEGFIAARGNTVANERAAALSVTARATANIAVHLEGSTRDADAYKARNWEEPQVDGTFADNSNGSIGTSWIGQQGFIGLAYSFREDQYGLPGHNDEYEECHLDNDLLECGEHEEGEHEEEHEHEAVPQIDLTSKRLDLRGELNHPFIGVHKIRFRASHTDYEHHEIEEDEIVTTFRNEGYEGRIEFDHAPLLGWHGVVGAQFSSTEFSALGEEAFVPDTDSEMFGLFVVEHYELNDHWHLEVGARYEEQQHTPINDSRNRPAYEEAASSLSAAVIWTFTEDHSLALSFANAERLPHTQELYARGVHLATNTYECGMVPHPLTCGGLANNASIDKETSNNIELTMRKHSGDLTYSFNAFRNNLDDYIYARTLDQYEDFRLIKYTQQEVRFTGAEVEVTYQFDETVSASLFGDYVRAEFVDGGNLPRIPAARLGGRLTMSADGVSAEIEYYHLDDQDDIASYEVATPGHNMLNATVSFGLFDDARYAVFVRASNLLDEEVWNHSSFLANVVPQPGRSLSAGVKYTF